MALSREQKEAVVKKLSDVFASDDTVTFVCFTGLDVDREDKVRKKLRDEEVNYSVAKKTLTHIALDSADIEGDKPEFTGQLAIVYGPGKTTSAREIYAFQKEYVDEEGVELQIIGGIFEGAYQNQEEMLEIAQIPGVDELRGMFANVIASPINGFAVALDQVAQKK